MDISSVLGQGFSSPKYAPLNLKGTSFDWCAPHVMGVLNITTDSFYVPSRCSISDVRARAEQMVADGATVLDLGGEATNPNVESVISVEKELARVIPAVEAIADLPVAISVDTSRPEVMREAVAAGASIINDVRALQLPGALEAAAELDVPVCLMFLRYLAPAVNPPPITAPPSAIIDTTINYFRERIDSCLSAGIRFENIVLDPGFGSGNFFGKTMDEHFVLLRRLREFHQLERPLLVGFSRKVFLWKPLGGTVEDTLSPGISAAVLSVLQGANIVRTHDVKATKMALKLLERVDGVGQA